jgi:hypothetical protein
MFGCVIARLFPALAALLFLGGCGGGDTTDEATAPAPKPRPAHGTLEYISAQAREAGWTPRRQPQTEAGPELIIDSPDVQAHVVLYPSTDAALPEGGKFSKLTRQPGSKGKVHYAIVGPGLGNPGPARLWWTAGENKISNDDFISVVDIAEGCDEGAVRNTAACKLVVNQ